MCDKLLWAWPALSKDFASFCILIPGCHIPCSLRPKENSEQWSLPRGHKNFPRGVPCPLQQGMEPGSSGWLRGFMWCRESGGPAL